MIFGEIKSMRNSSMPNFLDVMESPAGKQDSPPHGEFFRLLDGQLLVGRPQNRADPRPRSQRKRLPAGTLPKGKRRKGGTLHPSKRGRLKHQKVSTKSKGINLKTAMNIGGQLMIQSPEEAISFFFKGGQPHLDSAGNFQRRSEIITNTA